MPWLLTHFSFLQGCPRSRRDAPCFVIAAFVILVGASVAQAPLHAGWRLFAFDLLRRFLAAFALPAASCVAGRCPLPFRPTQGAQAESLLG
jgi:hypothetical protein